MNAVISNFTSVGRARRGGRTFVEAVWGGSRSPTLQFCSGWKFCCTDLDGFFFSEVGVTIVLMSILSSKGK